MCIRDSGNAGILVRQHQYVLSVGTIGTVGVVAAAPHLVAVAPVSYTHLSMAVEVPTAWAAAPKERPCAIGRPMGVSVMVLKPSIPPSKPTPVSYTHLDVYKRQ